MNGRKRKRISLMIVGLKSDGTVVAVGYDRDGQCNTESWRNIRPVNKEQLKQAEQRRREEEQRRAEEQRKAEEQRRIEEQRQKEEEQRRIEQSNRWQAQGLSRCCGAEFKGLFSKKCTVCGKPKDY